MKGASIIYDNNDIILIRNTFAGNKDEVFHVHAMKAYMGTEV